MQAIAATVAGSVGEAQTKPIAGLVYTVRFHGDGTPEELNVDGPIADGEGWLLAAFQSG